MIFPNTYSQKQAADLDAEISNLKAEAQSIARQLFDACNAIEDADPSQCDEIIADVKGVLKKYKEWGLKLNDAETERREFGE